MRKLPTFMLLAAAMLPALGHAQQTVNICDRTQIVQSMIRVTLGLVYDCVAVDSEAMAGIDKLDFTQEGFSGGVKQLKAGDFAGLTGLQVLDLRHSNLQVLPEGAFDSLTGLQTLDLSDNSSKVFPENALPEGVFDGLAGLQSLDLGGNGLTALPEGAFDGLAGLQVLDLDRNDLTALPEGAFDSLTTLVELDLSANDYLTTLPEGVFANLIGTEIQMP